MSDTLEDQMTRITREVAAEVDAAPPPQGYVYFIGYTDRIKIGYSINPRIRFEVFRPDDVLLVLPGTMAHERALHELFKAHRIRGEWFH
ncbi:GIY-YIG nuclease family protein, partial [Nonomuraea sp. RK-328]|nr:GIY-YIG nuclease family protein [Nonomuraea sp. RK-328]